MRSPLPDVVAGWTVGGVWAILCSLVARSLEARQRIENGRLSCAGTME